MLIVKTLVMYKMFESRCEIVDSLQGHGTEELEISCVASDVTSVNIHVMYADGQSTAKVSPNVSCKRSLAIRRDNCNSNIVYSLLYLLK